MFQYISKDICPLICHFNYLTVIAILYFIGSSCDFLLFRIHHYIIISDLHHLLYAV